MNNQFIYSVLQYRHSLALGEALNIGVLFSFPSENKFYFVSGNTQRVKCAYPNFDTTIVTRINKSIRNKVESDNNGILTKPDYSFRDFINKEVLPDETSSLQFTEPFTAINDTSNLKKTVEEFSKLLLPEGEERIEESRQTDYHIMKKFTDKLVKKVPRNKLETRLRKDVVVRTKEAELAFELGWSKGKSLHLVKPVSFDLSTEYFIKEKSVKFWAHLTLLSKEAERLGYIFDLLIGAPKEKALEEPYENAITTLRKTKAPKRIFTEDKLEGYSEEAARSLNKKML
jgi:hypothetical protein